MTWATPTWAVGCTRSNWTMSSGWSLTMHSAPTTTWSSHLDHFWRVCWPEVLRCPSFAEDLASFSLERASFMHQGIEAARVLTVVLRVQSAERYAHLFCSARLLSLVLANSFSQFNWDA